MPRIEGNFNIGRIVLEDEDYVCVSPETPDAALFYVLDNGSRYKIEFPRSGEIERANSKNWLRLVPVEEGRAAA